MRVVKTKALISFAVTTKLICVFVFAYADCWFSHEAAHIIAVCCKFSFLPETSGSLLHFSQSDKSG